MRITHYKLKRIINEEKARVLAEQSVPQALIERLHNAMQDIYDQLVLEAEGDDDRYLPEEAADDIIREEVEGFMDSIGMRGRGGRY